MNNNNNNAPGLLGKNGKQAAEAFQDRIVELLSSFHRPLLSSSPSKPVNIDRNSPRYKKLRRRMTGFLTMYTGAMMSSGDETQMDLAFFFTQIANDHFDEWYELRYPNG